MVLELITGPARSGKSRWAELRAGRSGRQVHYLATGPQLPDDPAWQAQQEDGSPLPADRHPSMVALRTGAPVTDVVMGVPVPDMLQADRGVAVAVDALTMLQQLLLWCTAHFSSSCSGLRTSELGLKAM